MTQNKIRGLMVIILATIIGSVNLMADTCQSWVFVTSQVNPNTCCVDITITNQNPTSSACYDYPVNIYQYDENGASTLQHAITINPGESITVSLCILDNMNTIEWRAYRNGFPTPADGKAIEDMSSCCSCPEDRDSWLTFDVEYGSADCGPGQCKVTPIVTIPDDITCYTHYLGIEVNDEDFSPTVSIGTPLPSYCIDKGQTIEYYVALAKSANASGDDWSDLCTLEATSPECDKPDYEACVPDCPGTPFAEKRTDRFLLSATCPGCFVNVTYTWRKACGLMQDMQILGIEFEPGSACDNCYIDNIYENVAASIIGMSNQTMGFEPLHAPNCSSQWRISNAGCWGKEHLYYDTDEEGVIQEIVRWHPCECDSCGCCLQELQVCRIDDFKVAITPIGQPSVQGDCSGITVIGDSNVVYECIPACAWAGQINGEYEAIADGGSGTSGKTTVNYRELMHQISSTYYNNILEIQLHTKQANNALLVIYDIQGNKLDSKSFSVHTGINTLIYSSESLNSGVYLYTLTVDGNELYSDKFMIAK